MESSRSETGDGGIARRTDECDQRADRGENAPTEPPIRQPLGGTERRGREHHRGQCDHRLVDQDRPAWWPPGDSNPRPHGCEPCALTS